MTHMSLVVRAVAVLAALVLEAACGGGGGGGRGSGGGGGSSAGTVTPVGAARGDPVTQTIGAAGGSLTSATGKVKLDVPPGALPGDALVTLEGVSGTAPGAAGDGIRLGSSTPFSQPVTLTFQYDPAALPDGSAGAADLAVQQADGTWLPLSGSSADATSVSASSAFAVPAAASRLRHLRLAAAGGFSPVDIDLFELFYMDPKEATIQVGQTQNLMLYVHQVAPPAPDPAGDELAAPGTQFINHSTCGDWSWSATAGTIAPGDKGAVFTAPASIPSTNPVAVSAKFTPSAGCPLRAVTLVSNITITNDLGVYKGTATGSLSGRVLTADVTWTLDSYKDNVATYVPSGTVSVTDPNMPCPFSPTTHAIASTDGTLTIDFTKTPTPFYGGAGSGWAVTLDCPGGTVPGSEEAPWFGAGPGTALQGYLSPDLLEIKGTSTTLDGFVTEWDFKRASAP
jgi:hypothetical protein